MKLGSTIQKIRKSNSLSQEQFGEKYHVTRQSVSNWENGKSIPDLEMLVKISEDFGVSIDSMLKQDGDVIKKIDIQKKKGRKYLIMLTAVVILATVVVIGIYNHYDKMTRLNFSISDQISKYVKTSDSPLEIRSGYFTVVKDGIVEFKIDADTDDGTINVTITSDKAKIIYKNENNKIDDNQQIYLKKGTYHVKVMARGFSEILLTCGYHISATN
jgi:transcriptional regulator with XRE-family HTH domain